MGVCESLPTYQPLDAGDYVEQILADKPDYLKNDDFIDNLYAEIR